MKYFFLLLTLLACSSPQKRGPAAEWKQAPFIVQDVHHVGLKLDLRTAMYLEDANRPFKGCVLYLQGLADSIMNHEPLFSRLAQSGFRVITYDYMEQGGSQGSMNNTRLTKVIKKDFEIGEQARWLWDLYSSAQMEARGVSCAGSVKRVIGWSTGGLAAYRLAKQEWAKQVALIAPGIHPKALVGEAENDWRKLMMFKEVITKRTLTRNEFKNQRDPHIDPIKPNTPLSVPKFAINLFATAKASQFWKIDPSVKGVVFVGTGDSYVKTDETINTLKKNAKHFSFYKYEGARHELDNELEPVAKDVREKIVDFFK